MYNINNGRNTEIMKKCKNLQEYSRFVALVRQKAEQGALTDAAMAEVLKECKEEGILVEFLEKYGTEVIGMLYKELTEEEAMEISKQDGYEEGLEAGLLAARKETALKMKEKGFAVEAIAECTGISLEEIETL